MIDASKNFIKEGNKNRLREQDIHRIVDTFTRLDESDTRYARMVLFQEIVDPRNDFNLNLARYIDSTEPEDLQDIDAHLNGGIPERDLNAFAADWQVFPTIRAVLFESAGRPGYANLKLPIAEVKTTILSHHEFIAYQRMVTTLFQKWRTAITPLLIGFDQNKHPKELIETVSETLLATFQAAPLLDTYDIYQHLMDYWAETMQDDAYLIAADGWIAKPTRIIETDRKGKPKDKGWTCDLIPKLLIVARYFAKEQIAIEAKQADLEAVTASLVELTEEHGGEEGYLGVLEKIGKMEVNVRLREIKADKEAKDEATMLKQWLELVESETALKRAVKEQEAALETLAYKKYSKLTETEIKCNGLI